MASELRLALGRDTLIAPLGLQESADVLGAKPRQLVPVGFRLAVVLDPMNEDVVSNTCSLDGEVRHEYQEPQRLVSASVPVVSPSCSKTTQRTKRSPAFQPLSYGFI